MKRKPRTRISLKDTELVDSFRWAEFVSWDRDSARGVRSFLREHRAPERLIKYVTYQVQFKEHEAAESLSALAKKAGRSIPERPSIAEFVLFDPATGEEFDSAKECM